MLATPKVRGSYRKNRLAHCSGSDLRRLPDRNFFETNPVTGKFANLGVLLLFIAGLESELEEFRRVGKQSSLVVGIGVFTAFIFGFSVSYFFTPFHEAILYGAMA